MLLAASVLADIDLLIPGLDHRGPTHSIILLTLFLIPAFIKFKKTAIPYYIALIQHTILGDFLAGGEVQLFWPITMDSYGLGICMETFPAVSLEWTLFVACIVIMLKTKDAQILFQSHQTNLILTLPVAALLLPMLFGFPWYIPPALILPHLTYLTIFTISILKHLTTILKTTW